MSYCTLQNLTDRFGTQALLDLTDRATPPAGEIDETVVDRAITDTGALIDGYLKDRYTLPLTSVPPLLTDLALAIAFYKLHVHLTEDKVRNDYKDALATLVQIANGTVRLDVEGAEPDGVGAGDVRTNSDRPREITPDNMKGFI